MGVFTICSQEQMSRALYQIKIGSLWWFVRSWAVSDRLRSPNKPQLVPQVRRRTLVACQRVASVQVYFDAGDIWWTWDSSEALETLLPKKSSFDNLFRTSAAGYGNSQIKPELLRSTCFSLLRKTLRSFQVGRFGIQLVLSVGLN
jgi:hypothetical protein